MARVVVCSMPKTSIVDEVVVALSMQQAWATTVRFSITPGSKDSGLTALSESFAPTSATASLQLGHKSIIIPCKAETVVDGFKMRVVCSLKLGTQCITVSAPMASSLLSGLGSSLRVQDKAWESMWESRIPIPRH